MQKNKFQDLRFKLNQGRILIGNKHLEGYKLDLIDCAEFKL